MTFIIFFLIQGYNVRVHNDFFEVFAINLQTIPYICDIIECSNKLILVGSWGRFFAWQSEQARALLIIFLVTGTVLALASDFVGYSDLFPPKS